MAGKELVEGPTAKTVRENIERGRKSKDLTWAQMSRFLSQRGRPIAPLGLRRIEEGQRRVDVDDLMAIAIVLNVTPYDLLLPPVASTGTVDISGAQQKTSAEVWAWALDNAPIGSPAEGLAPGTELFMGDKLVHRVPEQVAVETSSDAFKEAVRAVVREMLDHEK